MKKRIISIMLVLAFALLALPASTVSAGEATVGEATYTGKFEDWTAKIGTISAINDGTFQINAFDSSAAASLTNKNHARMAMWNGELAEGRFSVTLDTASILAGRGDTNADGTQKSGNNDSGIIFGGKGIKSFTKNSEVNYSLSTVNDLEDNAQFYFLYFGKNTITLALANKNNDKDGDGTPAYQEAQSTNDGWVGTQKNAAGADLKTDLSKTHAEMWNAAIASGKVEVTVAFSATGAFRVWINGEHIKELDADNLKPFGTELGIRNGMGFHVPTKIHDFKVYGNLILADASGHATYDPTTYTFTTTQSNTVSYFTNRSVKSGRLVVSAPTASDIHGPVFGLSIDPNRTGKTNEGAGLSYYLWDNRLKANGTIDMRVCISNHDGRYSYTEVLETSAKVSTSQLLLSTGGVFQDNAVKSASAVLDANGYVASGASNAGNWLYSPLYNRSAADYEKYMMLDTYQLKFNIGTTTATVQYPTNNRILFTDYTPLSGGYYGIRAASANTVVTYYIINNQSEAIDLSIDAGNLDLSALETGKTYSVKVNTFPAGSVINSGDSIKLSGSGLEQVGNAVLNSDGSYTVKFTATKAGESTLNVSVDNHIFGTLADSASFTATGSTVNGNTGDVTLFIGAGAVLVSILGAVIVSSKKRNVA